MKSSEGKCGPGYGKRAAFKFGSLAGAAVLAVSAFSLLSCTDPLGPEFQEKKTQAKGFELAAKRYKVFVDFPEGTYQDGETVSLKVTPDQFPQVDVPGFDESDKGILLDLDIKLLEKGKEIRIRLDYADKAYDADAVSLVIENDMGIPAFLDERVEGSVMSAPVPTDLLHLMDMDKNGRESFRIYVVRELAAAAPSQSFTSRVLTWKAGAWIEGPLPDLTGKKVCLLIHGLMCSAEDLKPLASYIDKNMSGAYDVVLGYEYGSTAPIGGIGDSLAEKAGPALGKAASVDAIAHSLGNLVFRRAYVGSSKVKGLDGSITRYVSLGGPQAGVPFGNMRILTNLAYLVRRINAVEGTMDLLRDLCTDGKDGKPITGFLSSVYDAPVRTKIPVLSFSGDVFQDFKISGFYAGWGFETLYFLSGYITPQDGIVAKYSAQSETSINKIAKTWESAHYHNNHSQLYAKDEILKDVVAWLKK